MSGLGPWSFGIKDGDGGTGKGETGVEKNQKSHGVRDLVKCIYNYITHERSPRRPGDGDVPPSVGVRLVTATLQGG